MDYVSVDGFIANGLKEIIEKNEKLTCLFATYKSIYGYDNGKVETTNSNLQIFVQGGGYESGIVNAIKVLSADSIQEKTELIDNEYSMAEEKMNSLVDKIDKHNLIKDGNIMFVVYVGLSACEGAINYVKTIKQDFANATVVVVACDCNIENKLKRLASLKESSSIDHLIVSSRCGGRFDLAEILDKIIEQFK